MEENLHREKAAVIKTFSAALSWNRADSVAGRIVLLRHRRQTALVLWQRIVDGVPLLKTDPPGDPRGDAAFYPRITCVSGWDSGHGAAGDPPEGAPRCSAVRPYAHTAGRAA